jgi:hypothetical protein
MKSFRTMMRVAAGFGGALLRFFQAHQTTTIRPTALVLLAVFVYAGAMWGDEMPRLDRHGDPLPPGRRHRL